MESLKSLKYRASLFPFLLLTWLNLAILASATEYPAFLLFWPFALHWLIRHVVQGIKVQE
jgi:hypothetical protein